MNNGKIIISPGMNQAHIPMSLVPFENLNAWLKDYLLNRNGDIKNLIGFLPVFTNLLDAKKYSSQVQTLNLVPTKSVVNENPINNIKEIEKVVRNIPDNK